MKRRRFHKPEAEKAVHFFAKRLVHTKGRWARQPFVLLDWQADQIIRPLFGLQRWDEELERWVRLIRTAFIEMPRKDGKSEIGAGIGLKLLFADGEEGAEVYSVAEDIDQANKVFAVARKMVDSDEALSRRARVYQKLIEVPKTGNIYRVIPGDVAGNHGHNPSGVIFDELHTQKTRELYDVMVSGQGTRDQPLTVGFTTAGFHQEPPSIAEELHNYGESVKNGVIDDPSFFYLRYGMDEGDDWEDEEVWRKANPALGSFLLMSFLRSEYVKAKESPAKQNTFRRLHLNEWTAQESRWLDLGSWDACDKPLQEKKLAGRECYAGLDLSSTTDLSALVLDFPLENGRHAWLPTFWIPEENIIRRSRRDRVPYDIWVKKGLIQTTPGNVIDYDAIDFMVDRLAEIYDIKELAFDRWGATQLSLKLQERGMKVIPFNQGMLHMSAPTKELEALVLSGRLIHGGNPVLRWMVDNLMVVQDSAGNIKPDKAKSRSRIDGIVAGIMALDRATRREFEPEPSIYVFGEDN